jgi:hypothetical protein
MKTNAAMHSDGGYLGHQFARRIKATARSLMRELPPAYRLRRARYRSAPGRH